jgi:MFS transporter, DHA2 family, multidrug resistance protein
MAAASGFQKWIITITVILASLLELIDTTVVNVSLPQIMGNLGATLEDVGWVITAYSIANVVILPMSGWLANRFGRRSYFAFSIVLFTVASFFCGNAHTIWELVVFRFFQGIGGGALLGTAQAILLETWPKEQHGMAQALFGLGVVVGPTIGPTLGGYITDHWTWPWVFFVNLPLGVIALLLTLQYIKDGIHSNKPGSVDWLGIFLLTVAVGSLQFVLERGESEDWFETNYITVLSILAVVTGVVFIWHELRTESPVVNLRILKNRSLFLGMFTTFVLGFGLYGSVFVFPIFCQNLLGFSAQQTGMLLIPGGLSTIFMMPIVGKMLQRKVSPQIMATFGFGLFFLFTYTMSHANLNSGESDFYLPLILRGIGMSFLFVPLTMLALGSLAPKDFHQGTGLNNMMRQLGGSFGIALITTLIHIRKGYHRDHLISNMDIYNPKFAARWNELVAGFTAKGFSLEQAQQMAAKAMDGMVIKNTYLLTYLDAFWATGIFLVVSIPLIWLQKSKKNAPVPVDSH